MQRYVDWMLRHKALNFFLIIVYYIAVVAPHKVFGTFLNDVVFQGITRDQYNLYVLLIALIVLAAYSYFFIKGTLRQSVKNKLWFYMISNIFLAALIFKFLFVINIEVVHFPQYAVFAILIFPLIRNYNSTLIWSTLAGGLDEAYQNFYLAPADTGYYDWNDVLTNLVGAVFGLLLLRSFGITDRPNMPWYKSTGIKAVGVLMIVVFGMWISGFLSIYPCETSSFQLVSKELNGFWQTVHPNVTYHVVRPLEGTILTLLLWSFYSRIGNSI